MAEVREMTIPLRAAWSVPRTRRANRAMAQIKKHVSQHMKKTEDEEILRVESGGRGSRESPPSHNHK